MVAVKLDAALSARLGRLARECGVGPETVALTGLALLHRRYTGETGHFGLDLSGDVSVSQTLARAAAPASAALLTLDGDCWQVELDCPDELAESMSIDLVSMYRAMGQDAQRSTVDLLPVAHYERRRPLAAFEPGHPNVAAAFAAIVEAYPENFAVLGDSVTLTYRELGGAVTATARELGPGGPVALLCQHGPNAVIGLLAALAAGRPYVPLDPTFPSQRLAGILADSGADTVLVDPAHEAHELTQGHRIVHIGQPGGEPDPLVLRGTAKLDDPAYLLYTSGSTGKPKGVAQSHRNVLFSIANHVRNFAITPQDRTSVLTSFGYDMAVTDTFGALLAGAAIVPVDVRTVGLGSLARSLASHKVSIYHSTPTVFRYLMASLTTGRLPDMRVVLLGGEEVTRHDAELARGRCAPEVLFVNGYGATEISFITQYPVAYDVPLDRAVMPVGHPLDGIDVVLVDAARRPVCLTGEVVARSPHVALGYWGQPELTSKRFIQYGETRSYLTGDLARRLSDGRLVFLARADRMVKIRGHRVELGEVEAQLAATPGVAHAAVIARPKISGADTAGETEIIGYAVPVAGTQLDPDAIRCALAQALPDFMLPRTIVPVPDLPMGPTGKLDVSALPSPDTVASVAALPGTALERVIGEAWCDVLGLTAIDRSTSVVQLGAHSLQMALVQERLEQVLGRRLPMARLFEFPTVEALAAHLSTQHSTAEQAAQRAAERMRQRRKARS